MITRRATLLSIDKEIELPGGDNLLLLGPRRTKLLEEMATFLHAQMLRKWDICQKIMWTKKLLPTIIEDNPPPSFWLAQGFSSRGVCTSTREGTNVETPVHVLRHRNRFADDRPLDSSAVVRLYKCARWSKSCET